MVIEILILLFSLLFLFIYGRMLYGRFTLPPGPVPLPIFGNVLQLDQKRPQNTIQEWSKKYGPVFTMWMANVPAVIITDFEIMNDALTRHGDQLSGRYRPFGINAFTRGNFGLLSSSGHTWREQRRFSAKILHDFGMGRNTMNDKILTEARNLSDTIIGEMNSNHQVIMDLHLDTAICICSIMGRILFGHPFDKGDPKFDLFTSTSQDMFTLLASIPMLLVDSWHWLRHIPLLGHFGNDELMRQEEILNNLIICEIESHKEALKNRLDKIEEPLDFVEAYLKELKRREDSGEDTRMSTFCDWQLVPVALELLLSGMETTLSTLRWAFLAMIKFPLIQQKIFEEIDNVIGRDRSPSLSDRSSMPYTMATLNESQRWGNIISINFPRMNESDFQLAGYKIPKNVQVIPQISNLFIDENVFPNPDQFDPGRFLETDGRTLKKIPQFAPFSMGKRQCLGEPLAKAELFLVFVHMIQHFELVLPPGHPQPSTIPAFGTTSAPQPFKVLVKLR